jgi:hypothetical protein
MHKILFSQPVDDAEVAEVSTDSQRSSSQQEINLFLKSQSEDREKSFVVEVVAVDFVPCAGSSEHWQILRVRKFPTNFHTSDNRIAFVRLSPGVKNE